MYKLENISKPVLISHLVYHLLSLYASGFEYRSWNFQNMTLSNKERKSYQLYCPTDPLVSSSASLRQALLMCESGDSQMIRCRAGGLSLSMLSEMVLTTYFDRFAEYYEEYFPNDLAEYEALLSNMKDTIRRLAIKDDTIRMVPAHCEYYGYSCEGLPKGETYKPEFNIMVSSSQPAPKDETIPVDCFGRQESRLRKAYRLKECGRASLNGQGESILMLNKCFVRDAHNKLQPKALSELPEKLLPAEKVTSLMEILSSHTPGWKYFNSTIEIRSQQLHLLPVSSADKKHPIRMANGRYGLIWREAEQSIPVEVSPSSRSTRQVHPVDCLLLLPYRQIAKMFDSKQKKEIQSVPQDYIDYLNAQKDNLVPLNSRFVLNRKKTTPEKSHWIAFLNSSVTDRSFPLADQSQLIPSKNGGFDGFFVRDLVHQDFACLVQREDLCINTLMLVPVQELARKKGVRSKKQQGDKQ